MMMTYLKITHSSLSFTRFQTTVSWGKVPFVCDPSNHPNLTPKAGLLFTPISTLLFLITRVKQELWGSIFQRKTYEQCIRTACCAFVQHDTVTSLAVDSYFHLTSFCSYSLSQIKYPSREGQPQLSPVQDAHL